jgi:hypothetical protein
MLLWKESLNNNDQQFYEYEQNEQPPLIQNHWSQKDQDMCRRKFRSWKGQTQKCGLSNRLIGL